MLTVEQGADGVLYVTPVLEDAGGEFELLLDAIRQSEQFEHSRLELWNLHRVVRSVTTEQIHQLAQAARRKERRPERVALVVDDDLSFGLMRVYAARRQEDGMDIAVFRSVPTALAYLLD